VYEVHTVHVKARTMPITIYQYLFQQWSSKHTVGA
jgi:hypothetical protein